jgi:membrane-associated phospholipid phosphatase
MRAGWAAYEWLSLLFFSFFLVLAWLRPLDWRHRLNVTILGVVPLVLLVLLPRFGQQVATFRQFLPLILIPMAYWQTAHFSAGVNEGLQRTLAAIDERIFAALGGFSLPPWLKSLTHTYLEFAYLLVYPLVPSGLAVLYFAGAGERVGEFWTVLLPPAYFCYATLPFIRTLPPRRLVEVRRPEVPQNGMRRFNLVVVRLVTHQANTFPSGHAAAAVAVALVLISAVPVAGFIYLVIAISIMVAAFVGRYHYFADVALGAALSCLSFLLA